ncbi:MAG: o-succinylbenzoate synthase [Hyphomicrobiales bacterium]
MSIRAVRLLPYSLPLREPWPTAEGTITERHGCVIALEDERGRIGCGDTAPLAGFGLETIGSSVHALRLAARRLIGLAPEQYREAAANLPYLAPVAASPAARHAIDLALHDLAAQEAGVPIARLLGGPGALAVVPVNAVIPDVEPDRAAELAREALAAGIAALKVKVGGSLAADLARVRAVREAAGADAAIRLDANQGWDERTAVEALTALRVYEIEYVEQPVPAEAIDVMARVRRAADVPVAADESLRDADGARRVLDRDAADVLIVKPMVLGGLHAARVVCDLARERGAGVVVTAFVESAVGRTGALHLAASLGATGRAHGLATGTALARDLAPGPAVAGGAIAVPPGPGLGVRPDDAALRDATPVETA